MIFVTVVAVCIEKPTVHIARRLYGGQTPWRGDEQVDEDELTRQRYLVPLGPTKIGNVMFDLAFMESWYAYN